MNSKNSLVTRSPWNCGGLFGNDIDGYEMQPFRIIEGSNFKDGKFRIMHGQLYGLRIPMDGNHHKIADDLFLLYGYGAKYSRNSCKFVMSRAARKRGHKTSDWMYNSGVKRYAKTVAR